MLFSNILYYFYTLMNLNIITPGPEKDPLADLIKTFGYTVEKYQIATDDDYILTVHRIPYQRSKLNKREDYFKPVLLVHALGASGGQWVVNGNKSLALMLSEQGFDVWILHMRGTSYSTKHKTLSFNHPKFWDYSWHEIGLYDISSTIDYILNKTGMEKLYYIGHSQGPTVFFVLMSLIPKYNEKVAAAYLLQPAALVHSTYPILTHLIQNLVQLAKDPKFYKVQMQNSLTTHLSKIFCSKQPFSVVCTDLGLIFLGGDTGQVVNKHESIQLLLKYVYDNVSVKQLIHYGQIHGSKVFQMYDYGPIINRNMYNGSSVPPEYDLSKVTVPTVVMYGTKDALTTEIDIKAITKKLPNVRDVIEMPWNHGDIILGKDTDILNRRIIESMNFIYKNNKII